MVGDFEAFKLYTAIKLHFTSDSYDVFKHNGRVKCHINQFEKRRDKLLFCKLASKFNTPKDIIEYYVANFAYGHNNVIYDWELGDENYKVWLRRKETMTYEFSKQMTFLEKYVERNNLCYQDLFCIEGGAPLLMQLYLSGHINLETMVIINDFENYLSKWESLILIWKDQLLLLNKIKGFIRYDKDRLKLTYIKHKENILEIQNGTYQ